MKILILAPQPYYRDWRVCIYLDTLLRALTAEGHHPTCLVYPGGTLPNIGGCRLLHVPYRFLLGKPRPHADWREIFFARTMARMADRLLRLEEFDLLLGFDGATLTTRSLSKRHTIPYLLYLDTPMDQRLATGISLLSPLKPLCRWLEKRAIHGSTGVLTSNRELQDCIGEKAHTPQAQHLQEVSLIGWSGAAASGRPPATLSKARGAMTLMYVGGLEDEAGIDLLINGFSLAYIDRVKLRLVIIGGSRRQIARCRRKAKALGVAKAVHFTGPRPLGQLTEYLAQADMVISPAISTDTPPLELPSLLDCGRPIIATRTAAHAGMLDDSVALLVDPIESELAVAIMHLAEDQNLRNRLTTQAKSLVTENYSRDSYRQRLRSFLQKLRERLPEGTRQQHQPA